MKHVRVTLLITHVTQINLPYILLVNERCEEEEKPGHNLQSSLAAWGQNYIEQ